MKRLSDGFAEAARACPGLPELRTLLCDASADLGFQYFALLDHASIDRARPGLVRIDNYPEAWTDELVKSGLAADDPVHQASRRSNSGFEWKEIGSLIPIDRRQQHIFARGRFHGLGDGFTIPANVPNEPSASCSFVTGVGHSMPEKRLRCAELIGAHALRAARRLRGVGPPPAKPRLSPREIECLKLVAIGKSDWEIARILGLSIETVHQYVKRARSAYGVSTRTQLALHALRDGWIAIEQAIPPNG